MGKKKGKKKGKILPGWLLDALATLGTLGFLGLFGWLLYTVHGMDGLLRETANRTDRIAAALPEVGQYFAWEEFNKPIDSFLVTTKPLQINDDWFMYALLTNPLENMQKVFRINVANQNDLRAAYQVAGAVQRLTTAYLSFAEMGTFASELQKPYTLQTNVDDQSSFIFRGSMSPALDNFLTQIAGTPDTVEISMTANDWPSVLAYTNDQVTAALYAQQKD